MKYEIITQNGRACLAIVVPVDDKALSEAKQSKSALQKAVEKGIPASTVPFSLVASTGGFVTVGPVKISLNVTKA